MNKLFLVIATLTVLNFSYAAGEIDLDSNKYSCNGKLITEQTTESEIQSNCKNYKLRIMRNSTSNKNVDDENNITNLSRVHFTTDNGDKLQCYYRKNKLYKCKAV